MNKNAHVPAGSADRPTSLWRVPYLRKKPTEILWEVPREGVLVPCVVEEAGPLIMRVFDTDLAHPRGLREKGAHQWADA